MQQQDPRNLKNAPYETLVWMNFEAISRIEATVHDLDRKFDGHVGEGNRLIARLAVLESQMKTMHRITSVLATGLVTLAVGLAISFVNSL